MASAADDEVALADEVAVDWSDYATVPDVPADAVIDPHWQELRTETPLPSIYLPSAMGGEHAGWVRISVWLVVAIFLTATTLGICLTYGPGF